MKYRQTICRCGGIGRHAVLRGQWGKLRASSNLAIGTRLAQPKQYSKMMLASFFFVSLVILMSIFANVFIGN